ncbi:MAG: hypothetical protein NXI24_02845 [bacterium]|nr:hypothetical protein [bacterium]
MEFLTWAIPLIAILAFWRCWWMYKHRAELKDLDRAFAGFLRLPEPFYSFRAGMTDVIAEVLPIYGMMLSGVMILLSGALFVHYHLTIHHWNLSQTSQLAEFLERRDLRIELETEFTFYLTRNGGIRSSVENDCGVKHSGSWQVRDDQLTVELFEFGPDVERCERYERSELDSEIWRIKAITIQAREIKCDSDGQLNDCRGFLRSLEFGKLQIWSEAPR